MLQTMTGRRFVGSACLLIFLCLGTGCSTYHFAHSVKLASYDEDISKGKAAGPVRGADCTWHVMGYPLGGEPRIDRAMANARTQSGEHFADDITQETDPNKAIRYINGMNTSWDGFNAVIFGKRCLVVKGAGYI